MGNSYVSTPPARKALDIGVPQKGQFLCTESKNTKSGEQFDCE